MPVLAQRRAEVAEAFRTRIALGPAGSPPEALHLGENMFEGPPLANLFALTRIAARCRWLGIAKLEVGPNAAAATRRGQETGRLLLRRPSTTPEERLAAAEALLASLVKARAGARPGRSSARRQAAR